MSEKKWLVASNEYYFDHVSTGIDKLKPGVYELKHKSTVNGEILYLSREYDSFPMPAKIYDIEDEFINRVINTFDRLDKNFGILLKGTKGTGKTITAKIIANKLKLPVVLINIARPDLGAFISNIDQECVLLFDEFEKIYEISTYYDEDSPERPTITSLLTMMDGVLTSSFKRLFMLTTNRIRLPDTMSDRPSRIRYMKEFGDISYESILKIFDDLLINKSLIPGLLLLMKNLNIITVDIVKSLIEEANIYNTVDPSFYTVFNLAKHKDDDDLYEIKNAGTSEEKEKLICMNMLPVFNDLVIGTNFIIPSKGYAGTIKHIDENERTLTTSLNNESKILRYFRYKNHEYYHESLNGFSLAAAF